MCVLPLTSCQRFRFLLCHCITEDDDSIITIDAISGDGGEAANNTLAVSVGEEGIWIAFSFEGASIPPGILIYQQALQFNALQVESAYTGHSCAGLQATTRSQR